jgi:ankyrin repeat protein
LELHEADHTKRNKNGLNCLHLAAEGGSPALIVPERLTQYRFKAKGLHPDSTDYSGNTPLHWAAHAGMEYSISALTPLTGRIDHQEQTGNTPLHLAAALGWARIVRKLVIAGADYTVKNN